MRDSNKYKDESIVYLLVDIASIAIYIFVGGGVVLLLTKSPLYSRKAGVFIISLIPHILSLIALSYMIRRIYSRSLLSYIEEEKISYKKFLLSSLITFIVLILVSIINRGTIAVNNEDTIETKLYFLILTLILIPFQTLSEEFIYRVLPEKIYSSRGELKRNERIILAFVLGLIFIIPHLFNREVVESASFVIPVLSYFLFGFLSSLISTTLHSYTYSWAVHTANNIFALVIVGEKNASLTSSPFFFSYSNAHSPLLPLSFIVIFLLIYIFERKEKIKRKV